MRRTEKSEFGFSAVELLLILVILGMVGFAGWFVYNSHKKTDATLNQTSQDSSNIPIPNSKKSSTGSTNSSSQSNTAGWKTAVLKYEKINYQYPANWKIDNQSQPGGCANPGSDYVTITSPSNGQVILHTGVDCIGDAGAIGFDAIPVKSLGQSLYLDIEGGVGFDTTPPTSPTFACLSQAKDPGSILLSYSKNITQPGDKSQKTQNEFCYYPYNQQKISSVPAEAIKSIENSTDFKTAKLIFESMQY